MFLNLRQGSSIYIFDKKGGAKFSIGTVEEIRNNGTKFGSYIPTLDITVNVGNSRREFRQVPANGTVADGGMNGSFISDNEEETIKHIKDYRKAINDIIDNVPIYQQDISVCDETLSKLSPEFAKERTKDKEIEVLKEEVGNMKSDIKSILDILSKSKNN